MEPGTARPRSPGHTKLEMVMPIILWLLGVPLSVIVLLYLIGVV